MVSAAGLLDEFRAARRALELHLRALSPEQWQTPLAGGSGRLVPGAWTAREVVIHIAAWLAEAGERIPALCAGSPPRDYDVDSFNAAAIGAAEGWSPAQALGAYKRAADRFEVLAADLTDDILDEEPDVRAWLESAARVMITQHLEDLASLRSRPSPSAPPLSRP